MYIITISPSGLQLTPRWTSSPTLMRGHVNMKRMEKNGSSSFSKEMVNAIMDTGDNDVKKGSLHHFHTRTAHISYKMKSVKEKNCSHDKRKGGKKNARKLHLLQTKIDALRKEKEILVKLHYTEVETLEKTHARAIKELHELQEQVERLTREKTQAMEECGSLETQLEKTRDLLAAKSYEPKEATEILKRCKEDRAVSRVKVDPQVSERNEFTRELMDQWSANIPQIEQTKKALACLRQLKRKSRLSSKRFRRN
ncbi:hypothetical protein PsorP6_013337 [Peronosclerospora sorghi]|uniref:Uncharacterized protein n=1 Tax=Peronosclerospora sorghi TaxID=230839 RepID=A0ACC0WG21_9STRA|nr:hypothetical protein PsorP6_013337 [Peronosclerospora sorghi]